MNDEGGTGQTLAHRTRVRSMNVQRSALSVNDRLGQCQDLPTGGPSSHSKFLEMAAGTGSGVGWQPATKEMSA